MSIGYQPMKELDKILYPDARYLYVLIYELESGSFDKLYIVSEHPVVESELKQLSAQMLSEIIEEQSCQYEGEACEYDAGLYGYEAGPYTNEDGSYIYKDEDMPILSSVELAVAYRRE